MVIASNRSGAPLPRPIISTHVGISIVRCTCRKSNDWVIVIKSSGRHSDDQAAYSSRSE